MSLHGNGLSDTFDWDEPGAYGGQEEEDGSVSTTSTLTTNNTLAYTHHTTMGPTFLGPINFVPAEASVGSASATVDTTRYPTATNSFRTISTRHKVQHGPSHNPPHHSARDDWEFDQSNSTLSTQKTTTPRPRNRGPHRSTSNNRTVNISTGNHQDYMNTPTAQNTKRIESFFQSLTSTEEKVAKKQISLKTTHHNVSPLEAWGDSITTTQTWPSLKGRSTVRLFHININGISHHNDYVDWEVIINYLLQLQIDIFSITEPNLDMHQPLVREELRTKAQFFDKYLRLATSSSKQTVDKSPYKRGGTITGTFGAWAGRLSSEQHKDKLGRWSSLTFSGKKGTKVHVITVYRPCAYHKYLGETTVYMQHQRDLIKYRRKNTNPREVLLTDLRDHIQKLHELGDKVILMGDFNDDANEKNGILATFLKASGLQNAMLQRHGTMSQLPPTYDRGSKCLDLFAISRGLNASAIKAAGYLPFYNLFFSDHRGGFIDIDIQELFRPMYDDTTRPSFKRFTTESVKRCDRYLQELESLMEKARIFHKIDGLEKRFIKEHTASNSTNNTLQSLIEECKNIHTKMGEFMLSAEKRCGRQAYNSGVPYSNSLRQAAEAVFEAKKELRQLSLHREDLEPLDIERAKKRHHDAITTLKEVQGDAIILRKDFLATLAEKRAKQWNMKTTAALKIIQQTEDVRATHHRARKWFKPQHPALRTLLVPAPITGARNNMYDLASYARLEDPKDIFDVLLRRNYRHLRQSEKSILSRGPLLDKCGWFAEDEGVEAILSGLLDTDTLSKEYHEFPREAKAFMNAMRRATDDEGTRVPPFPWKYGTKEFMDTFNHTKESTACGPSGLHMSHWKAACERPRIARVHAFLIWAAFEYGFSYKRWEHSWHCMLQKTEHPIYPKLRIIQLFEGDFNAALKYLIGRVLMKFMTEEGLFDKEIFGSRLGKTAPEAITNLQVTYDHHRIWQKNLITIFNDADGCYDRITPNMCDITMQRTGCPRGIANCHTRVQKNMVHQVRIAAGISLGSISFATKHNLIRDPEGHIRRIEGPTGGIGQGGGGGPMAWISVILVMLLAYRDLCQGVVMKDCLGLIYYTLHVISYVDDNTLLRSFPLGTTLNDALERMTENFGTWHRLLQVTGGDLCLEKCELSAMIWKFDSVGVPLLEAKRDNPTTIQLGSTVHPTQEMIPIERIDPWDASRVLGIRLPMTGSMNVELRYRIQQSKNMAQCLQQAPLDPLESYIVYSTRFRAMLRFPLAVTQFTVEECNEIQRHFYAVLLPRIGFNRHIKRDIIFGPTALGGRELFDLRLEQQIHHWKATLGHLRRRDTVGLGLEITLTDHQVYIGTSKPFFQYNPARFPYSPSNTRWTFTWKMAFENNLVVQIYDHWIPPLQDGDVNIMDKATSLQYYKGPEGQKELFHINQVRLYLQVFTLGDLSIDGATVCKYLCTGERPPRKYPMLDIPTINKPRGNQWQLFMECIFRIGVQPGYFLPMLVHPWTSRTVASVAKRKSEAEQMSGLYNSRACVADLRLEIPPFLNTLLGRLYGDDNTIQFLGLKILMGEAQGGSDGSIKHDHRVGLLGAKRGGHGYFLCDTTNTTRYLQGFAISPTSNAMSSLTTETYGSLALITLLHLVCIRSRLALDDNLPDMTLYIDNKELVQRFNVRPSGNNISDYLRPGYDDWVLLWELKEALPLTVTAVWVGSHQDLNNQGQQVHGPFSLPVMINLKADEMATISHRHISTEPLLRQSLSTSGASLSRQDGTHISDLRQSILLDTNGRRLLDYYYEKRGWCNEILLEIDWESLRSFLVRLQPIRRNGILKLMHNWQNVGAQKRKFNMARDMTVHSKCAPVQEAQRQEELCPAGCGEVEGNLHYMFCHHCDMKDKRDDLLADLCTELHRHHTSPALISTLSAALKELGATGSVTMPSGNSSDPIEEDLAMALELQDDIGWNGLLQGFVSTKWQDAQKKYAKREKLDIRFHSGEVWGRFFVASCVLYTENMWKFRNGLLHGDNRPATREKVKRDLKKRIHQLYDDSSILILPEDRKVFSRDKKFRLQQGTQQMRLWVGLAEDVLELHKERMEKNPLLRWLDSR